MKDDKMKDDIQFLKELQDELRNQDRDGQAPPRFWAVGDYKMMACPDGCGDSCVIVLPMRDYSCDVDSFMKEIKEDVWQDEDYSDKAKEMLNDAADHDALMEWVKEYYDPTAYFVRVSEEHVIHPNTMFLTKSEAQQHIKTNSHHYSEKAHTYAMTAWRAPKVERLLKILESFDWDSIKI